MNIKFTYEKGKGFISHTEGKDRIVIKGPDSTDSTTSPTEFLLYGMSGCSSLDIFMILEKMRKNITEFNVEMDATREDTDPKVLRSVNIHYFIKGDSDAIKATRNEARLIPPS